MAFAFMTLQLFSVAKAGGITLLQPGTCMAEGHCDSVGVETTTALHNHHEESGTRQHDDNESSPHDHKHRHSPDEPEHSHDHHHHSSSHTHGVHFVSGTHFQLVTYTECNLKFGRSSYRMIQGPFLDSVFRPPIA